MNNFYNKKDRLRTETTFLPKPNNSGCVVVKRENESIDSLLKRFKKKYLRNGIERDFMKNLFYERKSIRLKKKHQAAVRMKKKDDFEKKQQKYEPKE